MKKIYILIAIVAGLISFTSQNAFAVDTVLTAYIAKYDSGNFSEKLNQSFAWGLKPFLYVEGRFNKVFETWTNPTGTAYTFTILDDGTKDLLSSDPGKIANDLASWNTRKAEGLWGWSVQAWKNSAPVGNIISGTFNINGPVVPEPISSTLFLLGGAALGMRTLRNRKKKS